MDLSLLQELGLSDGQVKVYSSVLDLGIASLNAIQERTGIERRNIYDILNKLIERGLVTYTIETGKRTYQVSHPNKILEEIKKKENGLHHLKEQLPDMKKIFEGAKPDIRAEVYRGNEALKSLHEEVLEHKKIYYIGGNSGVEKISLRFWFKGWMKRRAEKRIWLYDLVDYGTNLEDFKPNDHAKHQQCYYKYCALPKNLSSPMVILIFGDKVAQILWHEQPFAFVLESKEIRESFMKYFDYFWKDK